MEKKCKTIVILATLDTKAEEALYLKELIKKRGHNPLVMDIGTSVEHAIQADFTNEELAQAIGRSLEEIRAGVDHYPEVLMALSTGGQKIIQDLLSQGKIGGLLSIGGGVGTLAALKIMRELPLTLPKLALSTLAFVGTFTFDMVSLDQTMMQSVADLYGINRITKISLQRAAGAICGMAEAHEDAGETAEDKRPLVAITALGLLHYVDRVQSLLLQKGYEPVPFHTAGSYAMEKMVRWGYFSGVLDLCAYELVNHVCGGIIKEGEDEKYTSACVKGIPQVIAPGALNFFPLLASAGLPNKFKERSRILHGPVYLIKSTHKEQEEIASRMAERINKTTGPIAVLIPLKGFSNLDRNKETPFYDPGAGQRLSGLLKEKVASSLVEIEEIDAHINDPAFAERATALLLSRLG